MKQKWEVRYFVTDVASVPVYKAYSKTETYGRPQSPVGERWNGTARRTATRTLLPVIGATRPSNFAVMKIVAPASTRRTAAISEFSPMRKST